MTHTQSDLEEMAQFGINVYIFIKELKGQDSFGSINVLMHTHPPSDAKVTK